MAGLSACFARRARPGPRTPALISNAPTTHSPTHPTCTYVPTRIALPPMHLAVAFELLDELRLQGDFPHSMLGVCHTVVAVSPPCRPARQPALPLTCLMLCCQASARPASAVGPLSPGLCCPPPFVLDEAGCRARILLGTPTLQAQLRAAQSIEEAKSHVLRMKVGGRHPSRLGPPCWPFQWPRQQAASGGECAGAWLWPAVARQEGVRQAARGGVCRVEPGGPCCASPVFVPLLIGTPARSPLPLLCHRHS